MTVLAPLSDEVLDEPLLASPEFGFLPTFLISDRYAAKGVAPRSGPHYNLSRLNFGGVAAVPCFVSFTACICARTIFELGDSLKEMPKSGR